jgi:hypothetical protein
MTEKRAHRRLAAILAADVVGYSRLMEQDEAGILAALKARHYLAGRYNDAIKCFVGWDHPPSHSLAVAAAAYAQAGRHTEAVKLREEHAARMSSGCSFAQQLSAQMRWCAHQKQRDLWLEGYRKAGFDC